MALPPDLPEREQYEAIGAVGVCVSAVSVCRSERPAVYISVVYVCAYWEYLLGLVGPGGMELQQPCHYWVTGFSLPLTTTFF